jgi:hypothetical protein
LIIKGIEGIARIILTGSLTRKQNIIRVQIERMSEKPQNGDFSSFAFNEINNLQTLKSQI